MSSFAAFLDVQGVRYPLLTYSLVINQEIDSLGRPASPTFGGTIDCILAAPGSDQPLLVQWMISPTMQQDGQLVLMQDVPRTTLKTISFFNAYCVGLQMRFQPGSGGGGSLQMQLRISPQRVAVGTIIHDNNWPIESHGAGQSYSKPEPDVNSKTASSTRVLAFVSPLPVPVESIPAWEPKPFPEPPKLPPPELPELPVALSELTALATGVLTFAAVALYPTSAGPADEWVAQLSPEDEQRWANLDLKRRQLEQEGGTLTSSEYAEWLSLDSKRYPAGRDANGNRPYKNTYTTKASKSVKKLTDQAIRNAGYDAHEIKKDFLGKKASIARYDLYKNTDTGEILILEKGGTGEPIHTDLFI